MPRGRAETQSREVRRGGNPALPASASTPDPHVLERSGACGLGVERLSAVGVLLPVEILVGFQTGVVSVAELTGLFVGHVVAGLGPLAADRMIR